MDDHKKIKRTQEVRNLAELYRNSPYFSRSAANKLVFSSGDLTQAAEKRALLVGINYYRSETVSPLRGCINDVKLAREVLTTKYDFLPNNITEMTDVSSDPKFLPTKENILRELDRIVSGATKGSVIYVHFSCHGARQPKGTGSDLQEVLVPLDMEIRGGKFVGPIVDDELHSIFNKLADGVNFTIIFDCCHSGISGHEHLGRDLDTRTGPAASPSGIPRMIEHPALRGKSNREVGRQSHIIEKEDMRNINNYPVFYAACAVNQTAADVPFGAKHYGAFSYCFYNILRHQVNPPSLGALWKNTNGLIVELGMAQAPQLYTNGRDKTNFSLALNHPDFNKQFEFTDIPVAKVKESSRSLVMPLPFGDLHTRGLVMNLPGGELMHRSIQKANLRAIASMSIDELQETFPGRSAAELEELNRAANEIIYTTIPMPSRVISNSRATGDAEIRGLFGDIVSMAGPVALNLVGSLLNPGKRDLDQRESTRGFLSGLIKIGGPIVGQLATGAINALAGKRDLSIKHREIVEEELKTELLQRGGPTTYFTGLKLLDKKTPEEKREPAHAALADILATSDLACVERAANVAGERGFWKDFTTGLLGTVVPGVQGMISGFASREVGNGPRLTRTQQGIVGELFAAGGLRAAELGVQLVSARGLNEQTKIVREILDVADVEVAPLLSHLVQESKQTETRDISDSREAPILDEYAAYPERIPQIELTDEERLHVRDLILLGGDSHGAMAAGLGVRMILNRDAPEPVKRGLLSNLVKIAGPVALNVGKQLLSGFAGGSQRGILSSLPTFSQILQAAKTHAPKVIIFLADLLQAKDADAKKKKLHEIFELAGPVVLKLASKLIDKGETLVGDILFGPGSRDLEEIARGGPRVDDPTLRLYFIYALVQVDWNTKSQQVFYVGSTTNPSNRFSSHKSRIGGFPFLMKIICSVRTTQWGAETLETYFHCRYNRCNSSIPLSENKYLEHYNMGRAYPHAIAQIYRYTYNSNVYTPLKSDSEAGTYINHGQGWQENLQDTKQMNAWTWEAYSRWCSDGGVQITQKEAQHKHTHLEW